MSFIMNATQVNHALSADQDKQVNVTQLDQTSLTVKQPVTHDSEKGRESHIPEILHLFHEAYLLWEGLQQVSTERPAQQKLYRCDSLSHLHHTS